MKANILELKTYPYCVAYELLKMSNDKNQRKELMNRMVLVIIIENIQMVFSNENISKFREKKIPLVSQPAAQESISKMSTTMSIADAFNNADIETPDNYNHWYFGVQIKAYPYHLLMLIAECLETMGFVFVKE